MRVRRTPSPPRRGVQAADAAIALPVVIMLTLGTFTTAMGVYYYQLVATLAREGARYASVHGTQYAADTGNSAATPADIYNNAILPMAVGLNLNPSNLTVTWNTTKSPYNNSVSVTVTYQWTPDFYITGPFNLTSTSVMPMSY